MNATHCASAGQLADRYTATFLLNCYCREIAGPAGLLSCEVGRGDDSLRERLQVDHGGCVLAMELPFVGARLLVGVDKQSSTCNYRFISNLLYSNRRSPADSANSGEGACCEPVAWSEIPELIVRELCLRFDLAEQPELLAQIFGSRDFLRKLFQYHGERAGKRAGLPALLSSERSLFFGHTFHPAPKSRQGFEAEDLQRYSPEFDSAFQLHYFAVDPAHIKVFSAEPSAFARLFRQVSRPVCSGKSANWPLIPCHPWQARFLMAQQAVASAIQEGKLIYLSALGLTFSPTASVRTLYSEYFPYFVKASLSLRITNSVRKNAHYELESAVAVSRLLEPVVANLKDRFSGFDVLLEPIAATVDFPGLPQEERAELQSHFGVILRTNPYQRTAVMRDTILAGTLFGDCLDGQSLLSPVLQRFARERSALAESEAILVWFRQYVEQLLPPVLDAFFEHGVAFEPHLQNVLLSMEGSAVVGVTLRDMEGTKLDRSRWPSCSLPPMSERARVSVCHEQDVAWRRVVYCLLINNLCQAVFHCSRRPVAENALWAVVREALEHYRASQGSVLCHRLVSELLVGTAWPAKANLITRFTRQADSRACYVDVPNPLLETPASEQAAAVQVEAVPQ
jgi:siderophore synthetase component